MIGPPSRYARSIWENNVFLVFNSVIKFSCKLFMQILNIKIQAPVIQKVDSNICWINLYPVHSAIGFPYT